MRTSNGLGFQRPFSSTGLSSSERDSRRAFCRLDSASLRVDLSECLAHFLRRDVALRVHD